ncbi:cytochrome P450 11B, mitochondrial-like [Spea bombifrons]|uniref:cytochrome P450 11B, mitochondrial-like n=1 Tax=Spea bombifrons TaxID=233779 RepID=UPI0023492223|nr:cytochrome P450 11B, mitochondrial-like [Spea bombifrons]
MLESRVLPHVRSCLAGYPPAHGRCFWRGISQLSTVPLIQEPHAEVAPQTLPLSAIPSTGRSAWLNLFHFWRRNQFQRMHHVMEENFQRLGPIYRERLGSHSSVNILLPQDVARLFQAEGVFPRRMRIEAWAAHRDLRNHKCGVFLLNGEEWRSDRLVLNKEVLSLMGVRRFLPFLDEVARDFSSLLKRRIDKNTRGALTVDLYADLFRFTLEASSYVLYGQRLGLLEENPNAESLRFIGAVETMIKTTLPLLFLPTQLMRLTEHQIWKEHMKAWDVIFEQADKCIQNIYQEFCLGQERGYSGIMAELLLQGELPLDSIKANVTELMAGGVDTTAMPLLFTLFELARNPSVQRDLREEILRAETQEPKDLNHLLNSLPLLKGAIKETLRLYPVGITVQRYPTRDLVLQNYHIPAGTLVQVALYPLGRSPLVFRDPLRYDPARWTRKDDTNFKALAFGFGSRQCIGRRIAETEIMLFLMHILKNFQIDTVCKEDMKTVFGFILMPEKPPLLTFRPISRAPKTQSTPNM